MKGESGRSNGLMQLPARFFSPLSSFCYSISSSIAFHLPPHPLLPSTPLLLPPLPLFSYLPLPSPLSFSFLFPEKSSVCGLGVWKRVSACVCVVVWVRVRFQPYIFWVPARVYVRARVLFSLVGRLKTLRGKSCRKAQSRPKTKHSLNTFLASRNSARVLKAEKARGGGGWGGAFMCMHVIS